MILIGLGSNLGDRANHLRTAKQAIKKNLKATIINESSVEETRAITPAGAPPSWDLAYLNQIIGILTPASPSQLLTELKCIEKEMGRKPSEKWAPRIIDLDILWYHGINYCDPNLNIPHPEIKNRPFISRAIGEIYPEILDKVHSSHL